MPQYPIMDFNDSQRKFVTCARAITLLAVLLFSLLSSLSVSILPFACAATRKQSARTYTTKFPLTENPISEGGNWINGKMVGLDWTDVQTSPGLAFGTESGTNGYDDSTAVLTGTWGPDQWAEATTHVINTGAISEEVELRLRTTITAHSITGYEINCSVYKNGNGYSEIVRWNGPLGSFTILSHKDGAAVSCGDGDVLKATIVGNVITVYVNGVQTNTATDSTYSTGAPGAGFYLLGANGRNADYGFTSFTASDASGPPPPTNLSSNVH
jgi:hypothetical protein